MNSENKANHPDSDSKTPLEIVKDFSVNPFYSYQKNDSENENNPSLTMSEQKPKINKELKVPLLFQTKPLKETLKQVKKLEQQQNDAKIRIHEKQLESVYEELKTLRPKPQISKNSQRIMENKNYVPIYMRATDIITKKKEKLEEERKIKEKEKERMEKALTFRPELLTKPQNYKTFEEFQDFQKTWTKTKKEKIAQKQFVNLEKEVMNHPFKPEINEKSKQIWHKKGFSQDKVENRLLSENQKMKSKKIKFEKTQFNPVLNSKTEKIIKDKRDKANILVEFLNQSDNVDSLNIQITSQGIELSVNDKADEKEEYYE